MNSRMQNNKCLNWNELNTIDSVAIRSIMLMKLEYIFDILCIEWKYWCIFYCAINNDKKKITTEKHLQNCDYIFIKTQKLWDLRSLWEMCRTLYSALSTWDYTFSISGCLICFPFEIFRYFCNSQWIMIFRKSFFFTVRIVIFQHYFFLFLWFCRILNRKYWFKTDLYELIKK